MEQKKQYVYILFLIIAGICLNLAGSSVVTLIHTPIYLDSVGTVIGSVLGGYLPGIIIGLVTNGFKSVSDPTSIYYASLNVMIAVVSAHLGKRGYFKKIWGILLLVLVLSLIGGGIGSVLTWFIYGFSEEAIDISFVADLYKAGRISSFATQVLSDYLVDLIDKLITVLAAVLVLHFVSKKLQSTLWMHSWQQAPLDEETAAKVKARKTRKFSLRTKILGLIIAAMTVVAVLAIGISARLFMDTYVQENIKLGKGIASLVANAVPGSRVDAYLEQGEDAYDYDQVENQLYAILHSSPDIEYIYVYRIKEDGCHVVFDLDTKEEMGADPGELIEFDESFRPYLSSLLAGERIEPVISDDKYGWLLTVYEPVYDRNLDCVCYAAADISMDEIRQQAEVYAAKMISLFMGFYILVVTVVLWFSEYNIILPVNAMSDAASTFAVGSDESRHTTVEHIKSLDIHTGDEIEDLYQSFRRTTADCIEYADQIRQHTEMINQMQNGLITVLAEVVESRDKCTGDHIRKTALYTELIMKEMKKEGIYEEQMTDEFMKEVVYSAPLHDVGKIKVPDAILNKPGRLTDEEFDIMKTHTTEGNDIIEHAIAIVPDPMYLQETRNLSMYHHEKWNGTGYPSGLKGEEIPLSARIMAVADVFDALVSKRSYKEGMPFDVAFKIIEEGSGSHFDPLIAQAFLNCREEAEEIARSQAEGKDTKSPAEKQE